MPNLHTDVVQPTDDISNSIQRSFDEPKYDIDYVDNIQRSDELKYDISNSIQRSDEPKYDISNSI